MYLKSFTFPLVTLKKKIVLTLMQLVQTTKEFNYGVFTFKELFYRLRAFCFKVLSFHTCLKNLWSFFLIFPCNLKHYCGTKLAQKFNQSSCKLILFCLLLSARTLPNVVQNEGISLFLKTDNMYFFPC